METATIGGSAVMQRGKMGFWGGGGNGGSAYTQRRGRVYLFSPLLLPHLAGLSVRAHVVVVAAEGYSGN